MKLYILSISAEIVDFSKAPDPGSMNGIDGIHSSSRQELVQIRNAIRPVTVVTVDGNQARRLQATKNAVQAELQGVNNDYETVMNASRPSGTQWANSDYWYLHAIYTGNSDSRLMYALDAGRHYQVQMVIAETEITLAA